MLSGILEAALDLLREFVGTADKFKETTQFNPMLVQQVAPRCSRLLLASCSCCRASRLSYLLLACLFGQALPKVIELALTTDDSSAMVSAVMLLTTYARLLPADTIMVCLNLKRSAF